MIGESDHYITIHINDAKNKSFVYFHSNTKHFTPSHSVKAFPVITFGCEKELKLKGALTELRCQYKGLKHNFTPTTISLL